MNKLLASLAVIVGTIALWHASPASADQVVAQASPAAAASPAPSPSPTASPAPHALQVSGFADIGYTVASNVSALGPNGGGRQITSVNGDFPYVFDTLNNQIQFHQFNLTAAYNGPIGAKVEATFGDDANVLNSYPKSVFASGTDIDLTQAYISGTSGQFTLIAGKFETLAGAEVIEAPSDLNFSRSILFGYAVPFTHTGVRLTWTATPHLNVIVGVNKGWDTTRSYGNNTFVYSDTNALTAEGGLAWNPSSVFSATVQGYVGQVEEGSAVAVCGVPCFNANPSRPVKSLIDTVLTYHATSALTLTANGDVGQQTNSALFDNTGTNYGYGTGTWSGIAGYVNYALSSQWSATARMEYFADYGGLRTGYTQRQGEVTGTIQWAPNANVIVRGEVRGDRSNAPWYLDAQGNSQYSTRQFGVETILKFP